MLLPEIGVTGQRRLGNSRALLVGCGALGSVIAQHLVRAGVGFLRIVDRDIVELTNLQRQTLFDENDVREELPKAVAAERKLRNINSSVRIEGIVGDVHAGNVEQMIEVRDSRPRIDLILDGTDNVETRYLINDLAVKWGVPWVYGAVVGGEGRMMAILPTSTPCLRCVFPEPPRPTELATCDTVGVLGPAAGVVGSLQAAAAIKVLSGHADAIASEMIVFDLWSNRLAAVAMKDAKRDDCATCAMKRFEFLDSTRGSGVTNLCGRGTVQIRSSEIDHINLTHAGDRLANCGVVRRSPYLVRCALYDPAGIELSVFPDGRVMVHGTDDSARARSIVARFLGA